MMSFDGVPHWDSALVAGIFERQHPAAIGLRTALDGPGTIADDVLGRRIGQRGDHDFHADLFPQGRLRPAAVLVPLVDRPHGLTVLLTRRTDHLHHHAGQVSFPGGRVEEGDPNPVVTALRETEEEVGLDPALVRIVGRLDTYVTRTGFEIVPVVGLLPDGIAPTPDPFEVADVFEIPLSFVVNPRNHEIHSREFKGQQRRFYVIPYENHYIWGATAGMLVNLAHVLLDSVSAQ